MSGSEAPSVDLLIFGHLVSGDLLLFGALALVGIIVVGIAVASKRRAE